MAYTNPRNNPSELGYPSLAFSGSERGSRLSLQIAQPARMNHFVALAMPLTFKNTFRCALRPAIAALTLRTAAERLVREVLRVEAFPGRDE